MERNYWASVFFGGGVDFPATVRTLEERGLSGLAVPQVYGPPFVPLAVAATVTKRIQLATGIAIGLTRSPFESAMAALDLDHLSQGRFILGLGTGPMHWTKGYYGMPYDKPVSRLREVVQIPKDNYDVGLVSATIDQQANLAYEKNNQSRESTVARC